MSNQRFSPWKLLIAGLALFAFVLTLSSLPAFGQANVGSGSLQGTVLDPSGAVVPGAQVKVTNVSTGQVRNLVTSASGLYSAGSLQPAHYKVEVTAQGFPAVARDFIVQVGVTTNGNISLAVGAVSQSVEVTADQVAVDTSQATVQGVLTPEQIENLPVDGRNFLNLAQLEPGVQLQDGQNFDPTKAGYSSVSFNGVNGRTARIELDGVDVSDETVGTTTLNISSGSIQEFQIARSSLDPSTELTSSGSINVSTKSGTNTLHGEAFGLFRDRRVGFANSPGGLSTAFQRNQFGGSIGGAIIKDKLFFFANSERVKQDQAQPLNFGAPFTALSGGVPNPFRDTYSVGRLDAQLPKGIHAFYRFAFEENLLAANFGFGFSFFANRDNTPAHAVGVDFNTGSFSHSFRFSYEKFHNLIGDLTNGGSFFNPLPGAFISVGDVGLQTGPNLLAPQQTYQANHQVKYDGSKVAGNHVLRYGVSFNRIDGGGFASFFGLAPEISTRFSTAQARGITSDFSNVLDYPIRLVVLGNGQGFFTEKPAFGAPAGGQQDNRLSLYGGDNWKIFPSLTLSYALRYQRDTGRNDADLPPTPCSAISPSIVATGLAPCSGNAPIFNSLLPGIGNQVQNPNTNFGPQVGFAWDPFKNGKTVIRGGAGIYYENSVFNNTLFDRPPKLAKGLFFSTAGVCGPFGNSVDFPNADGSVTTVSSINGVPFSTLCGETIGQAGPSFIQLQKQFQAAVAAAGPAANSTFIGNQLAVTAANGLALYSPNYKSTRSYQMNFGIQRELWKGGILSADYIRNIGIHFPLTIDVNHVGAARFLNKNAALNAIGATTAAFGCSGTNSAAIDCAIAAGATITDFANSGLDSGNTFLGSTPASVDGLTPDTGAAFAGANPLFGQSLFQFYNGRSVYNGLQLNYRQQIDHGMAFGLIKGGNFEASYTLSRFESNGGNDQNFSAIAEDEDRPTAFFGPVALDHTHQLAFGGVFDLKYGPRISLISHFASASPGTFFVEDSGNPGEIFRSDFTGDGTTGDIVPGTNFGNFGRKTSPGQVNSLINNYNTTVAGTLTPAGQALVSAGLFTQAQLTSLGAVASSLAPAPANPFPNGILRTFDFRLSYPIKIKERFAIEPSVGFFNLFNFANFGNVVTSGTANALALAGETAAPGTIQGTVTSADRDTVRVGNGTGTFAQGAPRETEFGLRITF